MRRIIKRIIFGYLLIYYRLKCRLCYLLYHGEGISMVIENLPKYFIIPMLKIYGAKIGENTNIDSGLILHRIKDFEDAKKINLGNNVHIGRNTIFDLSAAIFIDSDTALGAACQIWTHTGNWTNDRKDEHDTINTVSIGKAVICYSGVIISQNVKIGDFARVGAGSVIIRNVNNRTFVAGVPAKFIKQIR
jgi:acetyltransferase-like isoleucine patch superfamily enzyme